MTKSKIDSLGLAFTSTLDFSGKKHVWELGVEKYSEIFPSKG